MSRIDVEHKLGGRIARHFQLKLISHGVPQSFMPVLMSLGSLNALANTQRSMSQRGEAPRALAGQKGRQNAGRFSIGKLRAQFGGKLQKFGCRAIRAEIRNW